VVQISMVTVYWQRCSDNRQPSAIYRQCSANPFVSLST